jgi:hypothetical protein
MAVNETRELYERDIERTDAGWAIAVLILLAIVLFGFLYAWRSYRAATATPPGSTNVNVSVPGGTTPGTPNTGVPSGGSGSQSAPSQDSVVPGNASGAGTTGGATQTQTVPVAPGTR